MAIYKNIEGTPELFGDVGGDGTLDLKRVTSSDYGFEPASSSIDSIQVENIWRYDKITAIQILMFTTHLITFTTGWNTLARCVYTYDSTEEYPRAIQTRAAFQGRNGVGFYELYCLSGSELFDAGAFVIPIYTKLVNIQNNEEMMEIQMYCNKDISIDKGSAALALCFNAMFFNNIR